jgi:hypothetical protein
MAFSRGTHQNCETDRLVDYGGTNGDLYFGLTKAHECVGRTPFWPFGFQRFWHTDGSAEVSSAQSDTGRQSQIYICQGRGNSSICGANGEADKDGSAHAEPVGREASVKRDDLRRGGAARENPAKDEDSEEATLEHYVRPYVGAICSSSRLRLPRANSCFAEGFPVYAGFVQMRDCISRFRA